MADARRLSPTVAAGVLLVGLVGALLLWQQPWRDTTSEKVVPVPDDASGLLAEQFDALGEADTAAEFRAAAGGGAAARTFAQEAWAARSELAVEDVELRYLRGGEVPDRTDGSTVAEVAVSWRAGTDSVLRGTTVREATVRFRLDPRRDGTFAVRSASSHDGEPVPFWLAGRVSVQRDGDVRVVTVDGGLPDHDAMPMAVAAREQVRDVVPGVVDALTVVAPRTQARAADLVGRDEEEVAAIAAVTTTVDGSADAARVVVLNPAQFAAMDDRAAQVVLTHEATHVLTAPVRTDAEKWVVEGFADFVALHDDDAPLALSAGQALRGVAADGPPGTLPTAEDFARGDHGLGAVYELAWLVFRLLGEQHDDATIVRFYRDVLDGVDVEDALRRAFDRSVDRLTAQWRDYLTKSASTVS